MDNFSKSTKRESHAEKAVSTAEEMVADWLTHKEISQVFTESDGCCCMFFISLEHSNDVGTIKCPLVGVFVTGSSLLVPTASAVITVTSPLVSVPGLQGFAMPTLILFGIEPIIHWDIFDTGSKQIFVSGEWTPQEMDPISCTTFCTESYLFRVSDICFQPRMEPIPFFLFCIGSKHIISLGMELAINLFSPPSLSVGVEAIVDVLSAWVCELEISKVYGIWERLGGGRGTAATWGTKNQDSEIKGW